MAWQTEVGLLYLLFVGYYANVADGH